MVGNGTTLVSKRFWGRVLLIHYKLLDRENRCKNRIVSV